jgi:hypothetical protein
MKTKEFKAIKTGEKVTKAQFKALASKDRWAFKSHYKREPLPTGAIAYAKYIMIDGVPHKAVNGVMVPLTKKA